MYISMKIHFPAIPFDRSSDRWKTFCDQSSVGISFASHQTVRVPGAVGREGQRRQGLRPGRGEPAQVPGVRRGERKTPPPEIEMNDFMTLRRMNT